VIALLLLLAGPVAEAERLAAASLAMASPSEAVGTAEKALALTGEFDPIAFVKPGRKGEVVEDEFLAAREAYRRHRAALYEAMGEALLRSGRGAAGLRHLRRAFVLDPAGSARGRLGSALVASGRGREALDILVGSPVPLDTAALETAGQAADLAGVPSLQAELDRVRAGLARAEPRPEFRDGPLQFPARARLSTGEPFRPESAHLTLLYVADPACRTCSADLLDLKRLAPASARVALMAASPDQDAALRSAVTLYRYRWPYLAGAGSAADQAWPVPAVVAIARGGFAILIARPPLVSSLPPVLDLLQRRDVTESAPRAAWNRVPVARPVPLPPPSLLRSGLAPGEDEPPPDGFVRAAAAFEAGRAGEALALFDALARTGDFWLLSPEARLDRALCLAALGRREEARRILLRIGDSRFQEAVDRALEGGLPAQRGGG